MKLIDLYEARKNPELNVRAGSILDQLKNIKKKYKDILSTIYVTYTNINKLGANPQSSWDTPLGIYAYSLDYVIKKKASVPFQSDAPYIQIFQVLDMSDVWDLKNETQLSDMKTRLSSIIPQIKGDTPRAVWYSLYSSSSIRIAPHKGVTARKILMQAGITGVIDRGLGIIHNNEKNQAVFFTTRILKRLDVLKNNTSVPEQMHKLKDPIGLSAKEAYYIAFHKQRRIKKLENIIMTSPEIALKYAQVVIKGRWPEAEPYIMQDPHVLIAYAQKVIKGRWVDAEQYIVKSPRSAVWYAKDIIGGRWPEAEPYIMKDPQVAETYASLIIRGRWPEAEPYIMQHTYTAVRYAQDIIEGRWPEAEPYIMKDPHNALWYARAIIKGRWPEAEPYIATSPYEEHAYQTMLKNITRNNRKGKKVI